MHSENIPLDETNCFSSLFIDYISGRPELKEFYSQFPTIENFQAAIESRNFDDKNRSVLVERLQRQYEGTTTSIKLMENIKSLANENTYTITTGHQLNIFTGPLYFLYKIVTVINACKSLKEKYPDQHFVPVYWMASEDHDFEEISYFYFEGKKYEWSTDQQGAVGRFNPEGLKAIIDQLPRGIDFFAKAYSKATLADAARHYVNHLFGDEGLVVVDADDKELKKLFIPVMEDDLFSHSAKKAADKDTEELQSLGYKTQVSARDINFFYLDENVRGRIEKDGDSFQVVDGDIKFSETEVKEAVKEYPERFSPNVILRPLYQEMILPNLAYVGGPSEAVYWLQLKSVFEHFEVAFPLLIPRNFALIVPQNDWSKWEKTGLTSTDLFLDRDAAFTKWVKTNATENLSCETELNNLGKIYESIADRAVKIDPTLAQHLEALKTTAGTKLEKAEKKLVRSEKRKHKDRLGQITAVKDSLFPAGSLQERRDNFLNFYLKDPQFIQTLLDTFDAFEYSMYLLFDENN